MRVIFSKYDTGMHGSSHVRLRCEVVRMCTRTHGGPGRL